jgi:hypothetical protein
MVSVDLLKQFAFFKGFDEGDLKKLLKNRLKPVPRFIRKVIPQKNSISWKREKLSWSWKVTWAPRNPPCR